MILRQIVKISICLKLYLRILGIQVEKKCNIVL